MRWERSCEKFSRRRIPSLCKTTVFLVVVVCYIFMSFFLPKYPRMLIHVNKTHHSTIITYDTNYLTLDIVELKQFDNIKRLRRKGGVLGHYNERSVKYYKHNVVIHCGGFVKGIVIIIDELYRGIHTSGGSSFRILSTSSELRQTCSFEDYFNGTYVGFCYMDTAGCTNVTVDLLFVKYTAYTQKIHPLNQVLWTETVCATNCHLAIETLSKPRPPVSLQRRVKQQHRLTWRRVNNSLKLFIGDLSKQTWRRYQLIEAHDLCR